MTGLVSIFLVALLASVVTAAVVLIVVRVATPRFLHRHGEALAAQVAAEVKRAVAEAADEAAVELRAAVRDGVLEAGEGLLPELRSEVESGVRGGADAVMPELRRELEEGVRRGLRRSLSPRAAAEVGGSVIDAGFNLLFGSSDRANRDPGDDQD